VSARALPGGRVAKPNGWWAVALVVATEATLFGTIFGTYYYLRFKTAHWPPAGIAPPELTAPLTIALVLALTSVPMAVAARAARHGLVARARLAIAAAFVVQAGFFAMQWDLIADDLSRFTPQGSAYGSIYYVMLGAHEAHVAVGLLLDAWLLLKLAGGLTRYRAVATQAVAFYWHFVNLAALLVVGAQLSARI
jgi:heme/copper-type cytochrome/quinol oxidase subunit 3